VTGTSDTTGDRAFHAFLYSGGAIIDLNDLIDPLAGWQLVDAKGINNRGQITGYGILGDDYRAFLLTPLSTAPEPATWAMMIAGFALTGLAMRRRPTPRRA